MIRRIVALGAALWALAPAFAAARPYNDVQIYRGCTGGTPCAEWPTAGEYRRLILELGLMISPKVLSPSSTLGINGFDMGFEANTALIHGQEPYWTKSTKDGTIPRVFTYPTLRVRKGLPLSLEGGMSISYLPFTQQQVLGGDARFALHEGFSLVPDVAIQVSYVQFVGNEQLDMNVKQGSATLGYTWAFGDIPGVHTGRVSAWGGYSKGIIDSQVKTSSVPAADRTSFLTTLDVPGSGLLSRDYNKWIVGASVESGGFVYAVDAELVDRAIPTINMRWGAQF